MSNNPKNKNKNLKPDTFLTHAGRNPEEAFGFINTPPYRGSTVLYPNATACLAGQNRYVYGRRGNPTMEALQSLWTELEGAAGSVICPSGASAVSTALLSCLKQGDHLLMVDSTYRPTRNFCDNVLPRFGIAVTYYDPTLGAGIEALIQPNTRAVYMESPGSQTFEVQDVPTLVAVARKRGLITLIDNTWATPLLFRPLDFGVDIAINAATKYPCGHSDVLIGIVAANEAHWPALRDFHGDCGTFVSSDDIFLTLRGLRSMPLRLREQGANALKIAQYLQGHKQVKQVLHPALPGSPGHALFKRDFKGASGLFSILIDAKTDAEMIAFLDALSLFGMGYSWGGYESLAVPYDCTAFRTATPYAVEGRGIRLSIGLEAPEDLIADLDTGFFALEQAKKR